MSVVKNLGISGWSTAEITAALFIFCVLRVAFAFCKIGYNPLKLPVAGLPPGPLGRLRAVPLVFRRANQMIAEGFNRYSRGEKQTFFLAPWYMASYIYILPPQLVSEHRALPDHIASLRVAFKDENGALVMGGMELFDNPYHTILIRQKLTASLERLLEPVRDEVEAAFKEEWEHKWVGREHEEGWVDIPVFKSAVGVASRVVNRALSGMTICRRTL